MDKGHVQISEDIHIAVLGMFGNYARLEEAVGQLNVAGFPREDISVLLSLNSNTKVLVDRKVTKAMEEVAAGVTKRLVLVGTLSWLDSMGAIATPGVGSLIAAGPIMQTLLRSRVGGDVGSISGALIGFGMLEQEAQLYEDRVGKGELLLVVHCDDSKLKSRAEAIMKRSGANEISWSSEAAAQIHTCKKDNLRYLAGNY